MFLAIFLGQKLWILYFIIYFIRIALMCYAAEFIGVNKISDTVNMKMSEGKSVFYFINVLSISGLPPFVGFRIKLIVVINVYHMESIFVVLFLIIMFSFLSIYFYLKIAFNTLLLNQKKVFVKEILLNRNRLMINFLGLNLIVPIMVY
jgi:NADH-ubiquinone oxidoreductase chain 2